MKKPFELAEVNIPNVVEDHAHRIGRVHKNLTSDRNCREIIMRFTTFRHRIDLGRIDFTKSNITTTLKRFPP